MDGDSGARLSVAGGLTGFKRIHWIEEEGEYGGSIGAFGGLCSALSLANIRLVVGYDEEGAVKKGVGEDGGAHAGVGMVLVVGFGSVGGANVDQLEEEGEEGAEVRGGNSRSGAT